MEATCAVAQLGVPGGGAHSSGQPHNCPLCEPVTRGQRAYVCAATSVMRTGQQGGSSSSPLPPPLLSESGCVHGCTSSRDGGALTLWFISAAGTGWQVDGPHCSGVSRPGARTHMRMCMLSHAARERARERDRDRDGQRDRKTETARRRDRETDGETETER